MEEIKIIDLKNRILGGLYGHLLGDAFGVPYEFRNPSDLPLELTWTSGGAHGKPTGTWSDDGAMMLCQLASIAEHKNVDVIDTGTRFVRWMRDGYMTTDGDVFDIGNTTAQALRRLQSGCKPDQSGGIGEGDNGNGSLMRILPIGLCHSVQSNPENLLADTFTISALTHGHIRANLVCLLHNLTLKQLVNGSPPQLAIQSAIADLATFESPLYSREIIRAELRLINNYSPLTGTGYVIDSWWSAWDAFLRSDSYESAIKNAVRFGNDTDTTAAIAGGMAGVYYGYEELPKEWLTDLKMTKDAAACILEFVDLVLVLAAVR